MKPIPALIAILFVMPAMAAELPEDRRQAVEMPPLQRALVREDMLQHLDALNRILALLAAGKTAEAGELAERDMGVSSMGKHAARTQGMGPGRFMPDEMRAAGIALHRAASEFATVAKQGDPVAAYKALSPVTEACVACHAGYRLK